MTKRTISWMLCLMMVVSLFTMPMMRANAADVNFTVSPASKVIDGTGTAEFTAGTALDALIDQIGAGKDVDLSSWVSQLKDQGFDVDQIAGLLDGAGFNWEDIVGSLTNGGFDISSVADAIKNAVGNGDLNLDDVLGDFTSSDALKNLADALNGTGMSSDLLDKILDLFKNGEDGGDGNSLIDLIGGLIGRFGGNGSQNPRVSAVVLADGDEAEGDDDVTSLIAVNLKDALKEKYGSLFTAEKEQEFDELFGKIGGASDSLNLSDAVSGISELMGEDFDASKTIGAIMDATKGEADYGELVKALQESTNIELGMDDMSKAFGDALGTELDLNQLADALKENMGTEFSVDELMNALGENVDKQALLDSIAKSLGSDESISADDLEQALNDALKDQGGFDLSKLSEAMGEDFDASSFLSDLADKLNATDKVDEQAVSDAIDEALADQSEDSTLSQLANALKDAMGSDFDISKLTEALANTTSEDGETPSLDSIVKAVTDATGDNLTPDQVTDLVKGLVDSQGSDLNLSELISALTNNLNLSADDVLGALKEALGEDFSANLEDIAKQLLGEGTDFSELVQALKDMDLSNGEITDLFFGGEMTYEWWYREGRTGKLLTQTYGNNTNTGLTERTLTVTRSTAPTQTETYTYFCKVTVGEKTYDTSDAVLTINPQKDDTQPTDPGTEPTDPGTEPTTQPVAVPTLDNVSHNAYINGYEDGTFKPENNITRAEAAVILYRLMTPESQQTFQSTANTFPDVKASDWFNKEVSTLARASVITGYEDGTFKPDNYITRAEMATILTRMSVKDTSLVKQGEAKNFPDVSGWAANYIRIASSRGWINGYEDGTFRPEAFITRAEAVTMVNRMLSRNPITLTNSTGMRTFPDNMNPNAWYYIQIQEAANGHEYVRNSNGVEYWIGVTK